MVIPPNSACDLEHTVMRREIPISTIDGKSPKELREGADKLGRMVAERQILDDDLGKLVIWAAEILRKRATRLEAEASGGTT
jgi:hypothetical protein